MLDVFFCVFLVKAVIKHSTKSCENYTVFAFEIIFLGWHYTVGKQEHSLIKEKDVILE